MTGGAELGFELLGGATAAGAVPAPGAPELPAGGE